MPYCDDCDRFYNPNTLDATGSCPDGHRVAPPTATGDQDAVVPVPWHFKVLVVALVIYLGWRFIEFITWVI